MMRRRTVRFFMGFGKAAAAPECTMRGFPVKADMTDHLGMSVTLAPFAFPHAPVMV
jgi:hypothetical protein